MSPQERCEVVCVLGGAGESCGLVRGGLCVRDCKRHWGTGGLFVGSLSLWTYVCRGPRKPVGCEWGYVSGFVGSVECASCGEHLVAGADCMGDMVRTGLGTLREGDRCSGSADAGLRYVLDLDRGCAPSGAATGLHVALCAPCFVPADGLCCT